MTIINTKDYRRVFGPYLRKGISIEWSLKAELTTTHYVWRTVGDGKVRLAHRRNEGRLFSWDDPPETRHPRDGFNCRCWAEPYVPGETEFAMHDFGDSLEGDGWFFWTSETMIARFLFGNGRPITLRQLGHLESVVNQYSYYDGESGALVRASREIADGAREVGDGSSEKASGRGYQFSGIAYAHG